MTAMPETKGVDLLLENFQRIFMIDSHTKIISDGFVFFCRDIHVTAEPISKASGNVFRVSFVC